ncbi:uncharacterized protein LOC129000961 [Macrosteles quadrilineatus]|uniref:uncharacterized protein LOC129000961 n=1 Tax=Macrosteles quadrilineatus TaxID=74068 RepID=UPI0023E0FC8A|nr:uncharacterized protein LOC129000961 [Macrosteles quadrilineatus]
MESLPLEMVEKISEYLTPQDLGCCAAVSKGWRETFNQDILWKRHCDAELEEPLRNIPSVAESIFVAPEDIQSSLSPICPWRLAFMRETHLRRNWKNDSPKEHQISQESEQEMGLYVNKTLGQSLFLTDTLFVIWRSNAIEIYDVGSYPPVLLIKSDTSFDVNMWESCHPVRSDTLVMKQKSCIQVFIVNVGSKSISLNHNIQLNPNDTLNSFVVKSFNDGSIIGIAGSSKTSTITIFDLKRGEIIKREECPLENEPAKLWEIRSTPLSEDVLCLYKHTKSSVATAYVYSFKQLQFLPSAFCLRNYCHYIWNYECAIIKHFLAFTNKRKLIIVNYLTSKIVFSCKVTLDCLYLNTLKDDFIFLDYNDMSRKYLIQSYSVKNNLLSEIFEFSPDNDHTHSSLEVSFNKFVLVHNARVTSVFEPTGRSLKDLFGVNRFFLTRINNIYFNKSLTRSFFADFSDNFYVYYYW